MFKSLWLDKFTKLSREHSHIEIVIYEKMGRCILDNPSIRVYYKGFLLKQIPAHISWEEDGFFDPELLKEFKRMDTVIDLVIQGNSWDICCLDSDPNIRRLGQHRIEIERLVAEIAAM